MLRYAKLVFAAVLAVFVMGAAAQAASALTVNVTAGRSVATISNLTLRDTVLANVLGSLTLSVSLTGGSYLVNGTTYTVGSVTGGAGTISSPSGLTLTLTGTPWSITSVGTLVGSGVEVRISGITFTIRSALSTLSYTNGSITGTLNAAGNAISVTASSFTRGTASASFNGTPSFALSPAVTWATI